MNAEADIQAAIERLRGFGLADGDAAIVVLPAGQRLYLVDADGAVLADYPVSTAAAGLGCADGSLKTPTGAHRIAEVVGEGEPAGAVLVARVPTGEIAAPITDPGARPDRDLITTRILWLEGLEAGLNRGEGVDSRARYIYIHGTPEVGRLGTPASHGCVRMSDADVLDLADRVGEGALVYVAGE